MRKIKIIGHDNVGWSIDKDHQNLRYFLSQIEDVELTESFFSADIYFFVWHDLVLHPKYFFVRALKALDRRKKIVSWVTNDITQNNSFFSRHWPVDFWISPNDRISNFLQKNNLPYAQIPFFVSPKIFKELPDSREAISRKLGLNFDDIKDKILIGSFQRDSVGGDLSKPKWQKNPELLIEICTSLPKDKYVLILSGPRRHYLIKRCQAGNIPYIFVGRSEVFEKNEDDIITNNQSEETINLLYNLIDLSIVTSKSESGPKAILEASLGRTLICSTDAGLAKEFLHPDLIYAPDTISVVQKIFNQILNDPNDQALENYKEHNYGRVMGTLNENNYKSLVAQALRRIAL